ncbi:MAG: glycine betaine ABC transporter substrate-binding protein [Desulfosarcinaceae bacterium]|nr:glycine betaine ABC transporter substrate-binding protein [Desulfosarcinaceae bacterium]
MARRYSSPHHISCLILALLFCLAAAPAQAQSQSLKIAYEDWSSEIAAAYVIKAVLKERLKYQVTLTRMGLTETYEALADGSQDAMIGAWLPSQKPYYERFQGQFEDLGPNLENARLGLVVPNIATKRQLAENAMSTGHNITIDSIGQLKDHVDAFEGRIIGIETDSGMMRTMRDRLIPAYGLEAFELIPGTEVSMLAELANAIKHNRWIVVLGWEPSWKFTRWSLKFLDDPKGIWGGPASIHTITRNGLKADLPPAVFKLLDQFYWTPDQLGSLLLWNEMGGDPYSNARRWMRAHKDLVDAWLK